MESFATVSNGIVGQYCPLAENAICDGGSNCCDGLWKILYSERELPKLTIKNEENIIKFMEDKLEGLEKENGFEGFDFNISIETPAQARILWALLNTCPNQVNTQGISIGLTSGEIRSDFNITKDFPYSLWERIDKILDEYDLKGRNSDGFEM